MKRVCAVVFWMLAATLVCSAQSTFYFPHIANGILSPIDVWRTTILLTNPAAAGTAVGTITFTKETESGSAGTRFNDIVFIDERGESVAVGGIINFSIPAGQSKKYTSTGEGVYASASAAVATSVGAVSGSSIFSQYGIAGRLIAEAGTPGSTPVLNQAIFVDTTNAFQVGTAYANPGTSSAQITLTLIKSSGEVLATTSRVLGPGNHAAGFTFQFFPNAPADVIGTMQIRSTAPLAATALRFNPLVSVFTYVPPVSIASMINSGVEWLEQRRLLAPVTTVAKLLGAFGIA
jgi:hypothetical protein